MRRVTVLLIATSALALAPAGQAWAGDALPRADFNGDGRSDLAAGVPLESVSGAAGAGGVNVVYSGVDGPTAAGNQLWTQDSPGILDQAEPRDSFGDNLTSGNFNGDGYADLAISSSYENLGSIVDAGAVHVLYGSANGLVAAGNQIWTQDTPGIVDTAEAGDRLGSGDGQNLTAGDFNGDGFDDLVAGSGWEAIGDVGIAGGVNVIYGSASGLTPVGDQHWSQDSPGIQDTAESIDFFGGYDNNAGDFNGDGFDDLSVAASFEDGFTGAVNVIYGSAAGLSGKGDQLWTQDSPGVAGTAAQNHYFGDSGATGDLNADGFADLAVGSVDGVHILYGAALGLSAAGEHLFDQDTPGVDDSVQPGDAFGDDLAAGDFNHDGVDDLAVGAPGESFPGSQGAGAVNVLFGAAAGLSGAGSRFLHQDTPDVLSTNEEGDGFGVRVAALDVDGDGFADLAASAEREDGTNVPDMGAVHVIRGAAELPGAGSQFWHQASPGIAGSPAAGEILGHDLP